MLDFATTASNIGRTVIGVMPRGTGPGEPSLACPELQSILDAHGPGIHRRPSVAERRWRT